MQGFRLHRPCPGFGFHLEGLRGLQAYLKGFFDSLTILVIQCRFGWSQTVNAGLTFAEPYHFTMPFSLTRIR